MKNKIIAGFKENICVSEEIIKSQVEVIEKIAEALTKSLKNGGKIIFFGNGGSAADAQHLACELVGRFLKERKALPALALSTNTSILTAVGNDYSFDDIFSRQIEALGREGDVALGISTSGASINILKGIRSARAKKLFTVGFSGKGGGELEKIVDLAFVVPSSLSPRIQEAQITVGHLLCQLIEENI